MHYVVELGGDHDKHITTWSQV